MRKAIQLVLVDQIPQGIEGVMMFYHVEAYFHILLSISYRVRKCYGSQVPLIYTS